MNTTFRRLRPVLALASGVLLIVSLVVGSAGSPSEAAPAPETDSPTTIDNATTTAPPTTVAMTTTTWSGPQFSTTTLGGTTTTSDGTAPTTTFAGTTTSGPGGTTTTDPGTTTTTEPGATTTTSFGTTTTGLPGSTLTLTGTVTDTAGDPVPGASVSLATWSTLTNSAGSYELANVAPGTFSFSVSPVEGSGLTRYALPSYNLPASAVLDVVLTAAGTISGVVTDPAGDPVVGAHVAAQGYLGAVSSFASTITGSDGIYALTGLSAATHRVSVSPMNQELLVRIDESVPVTAGATTTHDVQLSAGVTLTGTVTDGTGTPVVGAFVSISFNDGYRSTSTDASGGYVLNGVAPGQAMLSVSGPGGSLLAPTSLSVTVVGGGTNDVDVVLRRTARLNGTLVDIEGNPVPNIYVSMSGGSGGTGGASDSQGHFTFLDVRAGSYDLSVSPEDRSGFRWTRVPVTLAEDEVRDVTITLHRGAIMRGVITDASGGPVAGVSVRAYMQMAVTDAQGRYELINLADQVSNIEIDPRIVRPDLSPVRVPSIFTQVDSIIIRDFVLQSTGSVSGIVRAAGGTPSAGAVVFAHPEGNTMWADYSATTDAEGNFIVDDLPPGAYTLYVARSSNSSVIWKQNGVLVGAGATTAVDPTLSVTTVVAGRIIDPAGLPVEGAVVEISGAGRLSNATGVTDANGNYSIGDVPSGTGYLGVTPPTGSGLMFTTRSVWIVEGEPLAVDVSLAAGHIATGVVTAAGGAPVSGVSVTIMNPNNSSVAYTTSAADGTFSATGIPSGIYRVQTTYNVLGTQLYASATFDTASPQPVNLVLRGAGTVTGVLHDAAGQPVAGALVVARDHLQGYPYQNATTASDGSFSIAGLNPARMVLEATATGSWYIRLALSDAFEVVPGQTINVDLTATAFSTVYGHVVDESGQPVHGAMINLVADAPRYGTNGNAATDATGTFSIGNMAAGSYTVEVYSQSMPDAPTVSRLSTFIATSGSTHDLSLVLPRAGSLSGAVTLGGQPMLGATVQLEGLDNGQRFEFATDTAGRYRFDRLQPGQWRVSVDIGDTPTGFSSDPIGVTLGSGQAVVQNLMIDAAAAPPPIPTGTTAVALGSETTIEWGDPSGSEAGFEIQRAELRASSWTNWTTFRLPAGSTTFTDAGLPDGSYAYFVRTLGTGGQSGWSPVMLVQIVTAAAPPAAPIGLEVTLTAGGVEVTWADTTNETSYDVMRARLVGDTWGDWTTFVLDRDVTSLSDGPLADGAYAYLVRALNGAGQSDWTIAQTVISTTGIPPLAPAVLTPTHLGSDVQIEWNDVVGETRYELERARLVGAEWGEWIGMSVDRDATSFVDVSVPDGTYAYLVRARNAVGVSPWIIATIEHSTATTPPSAPSDIVLVADGGSVTASWSDTADNETVHELFRARYVDGVWTDWTFFALDRNVTTMTDSPAPGVYAYLVRSRNAVGFSDWTISTVTVA